MFISILGRCLLGLRRLGRISRVSKGINKSSWMKEKRGFESCQRGAPKFIIPSFLNSQEVTRQLLSFAFTNASYFDSHRVHHHSCLLLLVFYIIWSLTSHILRHRRTFISARSRSALFWFIFLVISILFLSVIQLRCQSLPIFLLHQLTLSATSPDLNASQITRPSSPLTSYPLVASAFTCRSSILEASITSPSPA